MPPLPCSGPPPAAGPRTTSASPEPPPASRVSPCASAPPPPLMPLGRPHVASPASSLAHPPVAILRPPPSAVSSSSGSTASSSFGRSTDLGSESAGPLLGFRARPSSSSSLLRALPPSGARAWPPPRRCTSLLQALELLSPSGLERICRTSGCSSSAASSPVCLPPLGARAPPSSGRSCCSGPPREGEVGARVRSRPTWHVPCLRSLRWM
ncbi:hypothetical protein PVAP13_9NG305400 [Panicum virgatum]|uniref:Uncharacterized protein n=1 Tax=Panicum virgatum TaxID=38727 RepID=A0A8T0MJG5_PANVG|nr:hypothetical protein PVAP13_9NG305400 [Panicum virgatum]